MIRKSKYSSLSSKLIFRTEIVAEFLLASTVKYYRGICGIAVPRWYRDLHGTRYWYREK